MKQKGLLIAMSTLLLLCSCGGATYINYASQSSNGVFTSVEEKLTIHKEPFKLEITTRSEISTNTAMQLNWSGGVLAEAKDIATGYSIKVKPMNSSIFYHQLTLTQLSSYINIYGKGKENYKNLLKNQISSSQYTSEQKQALIEGKTVTIDTKQIVYVLLDEKNRTFKAVSM